MTHFSSSIWLGLLLATLTILGCDSKSSPALQSSSPPSSGSSSSQSSSQSSLPEIVQSTDQVLIRGTVTFDQIPRHAFSGKMQFENTYPAPVRGAQVDVLNRGGDVLYSTVTSASGGYVALAPANNDIAIRVWAKIEDTDASQWRARVIDNTQGDGEYAMRSAFIATTTESRQVDLHAASGLEDGTYEQVRASAPFAILDSLYDAFTYATTQVDVPLRELTIAWSVKNTAIGGEQRDPSQGEISSSYYTLQDGIPKIYLLGNIHNDADEYDRSVIFHEFAHYLLEHISRSDSVGGGHTAATKLDPRVAFNEALSNVIAAMIDGNHVYFDTFGIQQTQTQIFDLENQALDSQGWYNTETLSWLIYDIIDQGNSQDETVALGWDGLYTILNNPDTLLFDGAMSIFPFLTVAKDLFQDEAQVIGELADRHFISHQDPYGAAELDSGGSDIVLPIYHQLSLNEAINVCSDKRFADFNGLDVHRLIRIEIPTSGVYTITAEKNGGELNNTNPEFVLYRNGQVKLAGFSAQDDVEQTAFRLNRGNYLLDMFERSNADNDTQSGGLACFDVTIRVGDPNNASAISSCSNLAALAGDSRCQFANPTTINPNRDSINAFSL